MCNLSGLFRERAGAVSAEVHAFGRAQEALAFLGDFLPREGGTSLWAPGPFLQAAGRPRIPGLAFDVTREAAAAAQVGISQMDWAIAATGTLVQDATTVEQRLVSTLPRTHVAILGTGRILPDLASLLSIVHPDRAACLSMITGPSRTADIERVLTIGVHGPARLVVLLVEGIPS